MKLFCTACTFLDEEADRHLLKTNFHIFGRFEIFPSLASGHIPQPMMARLATNYPANSAAPLISLSLPTDIITQAEHPCISCHFIFAIQRASKCQSRQTWSWKYKVHRLWKFGVGTLGKKKYSPLAFLTRSGALLKTRGHTKKISIICRPTNQFGPPPWSFAM